VRPGRHARVDYEYERKGVCHQLVMCEPLRGWRKVRVTDRRTAGDFAEFIRELVDEDYPDADKVVLVVDNLNTHHPACLYERFEPVEAHRIASKLEWHYTPEHGSWLNVAEIELSALRSQCLNRRIHEIDRMRKEVAAWEQDRNNCSEAIDWRFTTEDARIKLKRLYPKL